MVRILIGVMSFALFLMLGGLVLAFGPDAGLSPVQGSLVLFACLLGVWQSTEFVSRGDC